MNTDVTYPHVPLEAACERISSGGTPSRKRPEYFATTNGHLWVKSQELLDSSIHDTGEHISDAGLAQSSAKYYPANTVLLAMYGATVGKLGLLRVPATVNQAVCALCINSSTADYRYIFYALTHCRGRLIGQAAGAAQQNLNQGLIRQFRIPLPPLPMQRKIAAVLSAYDDLIENNNRRIKILEEMAQRIYREWFVDFRYPGYENVRLVKSQRGPIPDGWEVLPLGEAIELVYGKALKVSERRDGTVDVYGSSGVIGKHDESLSPGPGVIVGRKGNVGAVHWSDGPFFAIDTTYWVRSRLPSEYCYYALSDMQFLDSHAAVPGLSRKQAYALPLLVPDSATLAAFVKISSRTFAQRQNWSAANRILGTMRDLLIPRLISGEIDVSDLDITGPDVGI